MTFFRSYDDDPLALLPEPAAKTLERHRLARAGRASDPPVSVGVFVVIIGVQKDRRAVVKVQAEEDAIVVTQLVGGKGKGRSDLPEVRALRRAFRSMSGSRARMGSEERNACSFL